MLTFPALTALKNARPEAEITLVTAGAANGLACLAAGVDRQWGYRKGKLSAGVWGGLLRGKFDLCLDFTGTDRSAFMAKLSGASSRATYAKWASKSAARRRLYDVQSDASVRDLHTLDFHHALLGSAGITTEQVAPTLDIPETAQKRAAELCPDKPFAVIHAGTAREEKYWLPERWAEVIDAIDMPVVLTGASDPFERAHLDAIKVAASREVIDLAGGLSLIETAAVIGRCELALGVDTAAMHLAACMEKPQIVLYGPTNPFHWRPRHEGAKVLLAGQEAPLKSFTPRHVAAKMADLSTASVIRAIGTASG